MLKAFGEFLSIIGGLTLIFGPGLVAIINVILLIVGIVKIKKNELVGKLWWRILLLVIAILVVSFYIFMYILLSNMEFRM